MAKLPHHPPSRAFLLLAWGLACLFACCAPAPAYALRSQGASDAGMSPSQGRQQALERALSGAVFAEAKAISAPGKPAEARLNALRAHLAPRSMDFVLSYQELAPKDQQQAEADAPAKAQPAQPFELELEVEVNRQALRLVLVRLGFFAPAQAFAAKTGPGVSEKDVKALEPLNVLLGLNRSAQAAQSAQSAQAAQAAQAGPESAVVTLERLPQGYYKAVLRQGQTVLAADAGELPALWMDLWAKRYAELYKQSGPGLQELSISGFPSVDAANQFARLLSTWDDALQEVRLSSLDLDAQGVSARFSCRVASQEALEARLGPALAERKLRLAAQPPQDEGGRRQ